MAVKVKAHRGAWWLFVDWKGRRKAKRIGVGRSVRIPAIVNSPIAPW